MYDFSAFALEGLNPGDLVAVAMSGGVDSSVAAALMTKLGYKVIGITLQLYDHGEMIEKKGACCAGQDIYDAKTVADHLGFAHYVLDYESVFKQEVIEDFADSYLKGETPIPCIRCNQKVKFKDLLQTSKDLGAKALVTGHYVQRLKPSTKKAQLHKAIDPTRDQSYFLFTTTQEQLDYLRFPLGGIAKTLTRELASYFGLQVSSKPDSQDICFVPNGNYASIVQKLRPGCLDEGEIIHVNGEILGRHQGIINYTIGQRKGLGVSYKEPLFVVKLDPKTKQVIVGPKEALKVSTLFVKDVNWLDPFEKFLSPFEAEVKIRSTHGPVAAIVQALDHSKARVILKEPEYGVAYGQAC